MKFWKITDENTKKITKKILSLHPSWAKKSVTDKKSVLPILVAALTSVRQAKRQANPSFNKTET